MTNPRPLAVVTGGSNGIGLELARQFATNGYDVLIAAQVESHLATAARDLAATGAAIETHAADLSTEAGVDSLHAAIGGRAVDALCVNAGIGLGGRFHETELARELQMIDLNVRGAVQLTKLVLRGMVARGSGRILLTSSIAATMPDPFEAVYGGTKVFLRWFGEALRNELKDTGVSVTVLMPSTTETNFFRRAEMMDTRAGTMKKDEAAVVAKAGFDALIAGRGKAIPTAKNKVMAVIADALPDPIAARVHRVLSEPGSATNSSGSGNESGAGVPTPVMAGVAAAGIGLALWAAIRRPRPPVKIGGAVTSTDRPKALHIAMEARTGKEDAVERLLYDILDEVATEPNTRPWFGLRRDDRSFEIFETFPDEAARAAHLSGKGAALLMARSNELLASPARINKLDLVGKKAG